MCASRLRCCARIAVKMYPKPQADFSMARTSLIRSENEFIAYHVSVVGVAANQRPPLAVCISRYCLAGYCPLSTPYAYAY